MADTDEQVTRLLAEKIELVPIGSIHAHPDNPNEGDVGAIVESVDALDGAFYQVIFVQQSTARIIAGEHRWRSLQARGVDTAPVVFLDVDDEQAMRIMVGDNEIPRQRSRPDQALLLDALLALEQQSTSGLAGTGYDRDMLDDLIQLQAGPPNLDDIINQHGAPQPGDFWPTIRLVIPQELKKRYLEVTGHLQTDEERLTMLLDAAAPR